MKIVTFQLSCPSSWTCVGSIEKGAPTAHSKSMRRGEGRVCVCVWGGHLLTQLQGGCAEAGGLGGEVPRRDAELHGRHQRIHLGPPHHQLMAWPLPKVCVAPDHLRQHTPMFSSAYSA